MYPRPVRFWYRQVKGRDRVTGLVVDHESINDIILLTRVFHRLLLSTPTLRVLFGPDDLSTYVVKKDYKNPRHPYHVRDVSRVKSPLNIEVYTPVTPVSLLESRGGPKRRRRLSGVDSDVRRVVPGVGH